MVSREEGSAVIRTLSMALALLAVLAAGAHAQANAQEASTQPSAEPTERPVEDVIVMTCRDAWLESGKSEKEFAGILVELALISLDNRSLELSYTRETGQAMGKEIRSTCEADPDALLYAVVDGVVRKNGTPKAAG
jgi:hypothetical protein